ncbi:hypothetical protein LSUE1_G005681, partial [Lachnellula suecica]
MESLKNATGFGSTAPDHTEEQKQQIYNSLPEEDKKKQTYTEWVKEAYADQYEKWMPWIEDQYLKWFGKDNKASYATKGNLLPLLKMAATLILEFKTDTLDQTKVTGIKQVDQVQDDVHNLVANQVGPNGFLAPVGNLVSNEGITRAERGGKDDSGTGSYGGPASAYTDPMIKNAQGAGESVAGGAQSIGQGVAGGAQTAG